MLRTALVAALAVLLGGCFTFRSTIAVRPDGSGTITETLRLSGPAARRLQGDDAPLSSAETLLARAQRLGQGVTLVRTDTLGGVRTTVYAFRSIANLRYTLPDNATSADELARAAGAPPLVTFAFSPAAGGTPAEVRVVVPPAGPPAAVPDSAAVMQAAQGLEMARVVLGSARLTVEVVAEGAAPRSATLLDIPFGPLFDLVERHPALAARQTLPLDDIRALATPGDGLIVRAPGTLAIRVE